MIIRPEQYVLKNLILENIKLLLLRSWIELSFSGSKHNINRIVFTWI